MTISDSTTPNNSGPDGVTPPYTNRWRRAGVCLCPGSAQGEGGGVNCRREMHTDDHGEERGEIDIQVRRDA